MSLWDVSYFKLRAIKAQKTLEETLNYSLMPRRIYLEDLFQEVSYWHRVTIMWTRCADWEEPSKVSLLRVFSVSHCIWWPSKHLLTKHLFFYFYVKVQNPFSFHWKRLWCWERFKAKGGGWQRMSWLDRITDSMGTNHSKLWEIVKDREAWLTTDHRIAEIQPWRSNWTTATQTPDPKFFSVFSHGWFLRWEFQPFWWIIQLSCVSPMCVCVCKLCHFCHSQLFVILWIVACQASLSMGLSSQEYCIGLLCPPPEDLPDPGIETMSPALQVNSLPLNH